MTELAPNAFGKAVRNQMSQVTAVDMFSLRCITRSCPGFGLEGRLAVAVSLSVLTLTEDGHARLMGCAEIMG